MKHSFKEKTSWLAEVIKAVLGRHGRNLFRNMKYVKGDLKKQIKKNKRFKNIHCGERCFILGNGPSIKNVDFKLLENEYVFTVNQLSRMDNFAELKTNYHLWGDDIYFKPTDNDRMVEIMKAVKTEGSNPEVFYTYTAKPMIDNYKLKNYLKVNYFKQGAEVSWGMQDKLNFTKLVPHCGTVVQYAIILAYYMGFKEIYLLGCECTGILKTIESVSNIRMGEYYAYEIDKTDKNNFSSNIVMEFFGHYELLYDYGIYHKYLEDKGVKLVNCTDGGILKNIPCDTLENVLNKIRVEE